MYTEGECSVTQHTCNGISDLEVLRRKIKTTNHTIAVDEPLFTIPQVKRAVK